MDTTWGTPQLALNANTAATAVYVGGSGTDTLTFNYVVAAGDAAFPLDYISTSALILNGGTIEGAAGDAANLTLPAAGSDGLATLEIVVDTGVPAVTGVSSSATAGQWFAAGATIPITVTFSQPVTVDTTGGTPQLALDSNDAAAYVDGSGTNTLTFDYSVSPGDAASPLDYTSIFALILNGGTIEDAAGDAANVVLPPTATDGLATLSITVDTTTPSITDVSSAVAAGTWCVGTGATVPITVTFCEPVIVDTTGGLPQLALNADATATAVYVGGSGTSTLTFDYIVAAGDTACPLDYTSTSALTLNGGTIEDAAGNVADPTLPATGFNGLARSYLVVVPDPFIPLISAVSCSAAAGVSLKRGRYGPDHGLLQRTGHRRHDRRRRSWR